MINYGDTGLPVIGLGDFISQEQANAIVAPQDDVVTHYTIFGKAAVERLLLGDQVHGLRIYMAEEDGGFNLVLVPIDANGYDLINMFDLTHVPDKVRVKGKPTAMSFRILNRGIPCPPKCIGTGPGSSGGNGGGSW